MFSKMLVKLSILNIIQIFLIFPNYSHAISFYGSSGSLWYQLISIPDKNGLTFNASLKKGYKVPTYSQCSFFPHIELLFNYDANREPSNNVFEINPCIEFKYDSFSIGSKYSLGYYLPYAEISSITKNKNIYKTLQIYLTYWCQYDKYYKKRFHFVIEEWFNCNYIIQHDDIIAKKNLLFDYYIEFGLLFNTKKFTYIRPTYRLDVNIDKKGLPWNNIITNSFGIKLQTNKKHYTLSVFYFNEFYNSNAYFKNIENQNWDYENDRINHNGVKILFSYWNGW